MEQTAHVVELASDDDKNCPKPLDVDTILNEIGDSGPYQIFVSISAGLFSTYGSFVILNFVFGAAIPDHRYGKFRIVISS